MIEHPPEPADRPAAGEAAAELAGGVPYDPRLEAPTEPLPVIESPLVPRPAHVAADEPGGRAVTWALAAIVVGIAVVVLLAASAMQVSRRPALDPLDPFAAPPPEATAPTTTPGATTTVPVTSATTGPPVLPADGRDQPVLDDSSTCDQIEAQKQALDAEKQALDETHRHNRPARERLKREIEEQKHALEQLEQQNGC